MDAIESAIRGALTRGDAGDRTFRERVYRSVFAALERKLAETAGMGEADAQRRRELLKQHIVGIEREYAVSAPGPTQRPVPRAAEAPADGVAPPVVAVDRRPAQPRPVAPEPRMEPVVPQARAPRDDADPLAIRPRREIEAPEMVLPGLAGDMPGGGYGEIDDGRRRPWGLLLILAALVLALALGAWLVLGSGLFGGVGPASTPPAAVDVDDAAPGGPPPLNQDGGAEREWITVFAASDPSAVAATSGATVEAMQEEGQPFLRLRSPSPNAALRVRIDGAALAAVAGGPVVFNIVARAQEGQETQISVSCDFGVLGDCGRRRYVVGLHRADFLFDLELGAADASPDGTISIVTDVEGAGRAIDLFEIRLARAE